MWHADIAFITRVLDTLFLRHITGVLRVSTDPQSRNFHTYNTHNINTRNMYDSQALHGRLLTCYDLFHAFWLRAPYRVVLLS